MIALFLVAVLTLLSLRGLENSLTRERRIKEAELLFAGQAYRQAIKTYYENTPGSDKKFPPDLNALLEDGRTTRLSRPLRKMYFDPMTSSNTWGMVLAPTGGVMGVFSMSTLQPIKVDGFPEEWVALTNAKKYQDWKFIYQAN